MAKIACGRIKTWRENGLLTENQSVVLRLLNEGGTMTATEILMARRAEIGDDVVELGWSWHKRLSELRRMGAVENCGSKTCQYSGKPVLLWRVTGATPDPMLVVQARRERERKPDKEGETDSEELRSALADVTRNLGFSITSTEKMAKYRTMLPETAVWLQEAKATHAHALALLAG